MGFYAGDDQAFFSPRGTRLRFNFRVAPFWGGSDHIMFNDSAFSIPTPMLGHGDVFHHTNLDTPDKCDPTEMKRIISLSLAATILIANAGEGEALKIAREIYSRAALRMTERTKKSLGLLHQFSVEPKKRQSLAELHSNILNYPQVQARIESANLEETALRQLRNLTPATTRRGSRGRPGACNERWGLGSTGCRQSFHGRGRTFTSRFQA